MLHPADPLPTAFRLMPFIGISGYLLGVVLSVLRAYSAVAVERLVAVAALGALIALSASLAGMWLLTAIDALLLAMLAIEHHRVEISHRLVKVSRNASNPHSAEVGDA